MMTPWRIILFITVLWIALITVVNLCNLEFDFFTDHFIFILLCLILIVSIKRFESAKKHEIKKLLIEKSEKGQDDLKSIDPPNQFLNLFLFLLAIIFVFSLIFQVPEVENLFPENYSGQIKKLFDYLYQYSSQLRATLVMLAGYIAFIIMIIILSWRAFRIELIRNTLIGKTSKEIGAISLFLIGILWFLYLSWAALTRHNTFHSKAWDLAIFAQLIHNFKNGVFFECNVRGLSNIFADHFTPIIYVFSPLLYVWNDPSRLLLIIQALFITLGAIPVYLLASKKSGSRTASIGIACVYLFLPTLQFINLADFHPVVLAIPILLSAWYAWECRKYLLMYVFVFLAMMCQEEVWILIGSMGLFLALFERERKHGIILTILGWGGFIALVLWFFPIFRGGEEYFYLHRYAYLGSSGAEIIRNLILHPTLWLGKIFSSRVLMFIILMLLPVGFLPLWRPKYLLMLLPTLLYSALSNEPLQTSIFAQYAASYVPFLMIASIYGMVSFAAGSEKSQLNAALRSVSSTVFIGALACNIFFSPLPHGYAYQESQVIKEFAYEIIKEAITLIPENVKVSVGSKFASHLIRRELFLIPDYGKADYIVFDLDDYHDPKTGEKIRELLSQSGWELKYYKLNVLVLKRGEGMKSLQSLLNRSYLDASDIIRKIRDEELFETVMKYSFDISLHSCYSNLHSGPIHTQFIFGYSTPESLSCINEELYIFYTNFIKENSCGTPYFGAFLWESEFHDGLRFRIKPQAIIVNFGDNLITYEEWVPIIEKSYLKNWSQIFQWIYTSPDVLDVWSYTIPQTTPDFLILPYPEEYPNSLKEYFTEIYIQNRFFIHPMTKETLPKNCFLDKLHRGPIMY